MNAFYFILIVFTGWVAQVDWESQRNAMVKTQIQARGIKDQNVLDAMARVERHRFVPRGVQHLAYTDQPLPIGEGQTISQPYIVAYMTEALNLKPTDKVLEVGTGSGYQAAILGELCKEVYTIEIFASLATTSRTLLEDLEYSNIKVRHGDGYLGWPEQAPFDAIIVTCSPTKIPQPLQDQLREGGTMIIPVGETYTQELILLKKKGGSMKTISRLPVRFVPMIDEKGRRH